MILNGLGDCVHVERPAVLLRRHHLRSTSGTGDAVCLTACMPSCLLTRDSDPLLRTYLQQLQVVRSGRLSTWRAQKMEWQDSDEAHKCHRRAVRAMRLT